MIRFHFCLPQALPSYSGTVFLPRVPDLAGSKLPTSEIGAKELITEEISKIKLAPAYSEDEDKCKLVISPSYAEKTTTERLKV